MFIGTSKFTDLTSINLKILAFAVFVITLNRESKSKVILTAGKT